MSSNNSKLIHTILRKKDGIVWEGDINSFSSFNEIGAFDVLPEHSHFVGLIEQYIVVRQNESEKKWEIDRGLMSVVDGTIEVFLSY